MPIDTQPPKPGGEIPHDELVRRMLFNARLLWFALLMGQWLFAAVVVFSNSTHPEPPAEDTNVMTYVAVGVFFVFVPTGYFLRMQIFKRHWQGDVITPQGYYMGTLLLLAMCEGVSLIGLVATMVQREWGLAAVVSAAAMVVQLINFPTGAPMRPANPYQHTR